MKERPILFSAPMVRALLAGTKTQTRRPVRQQPERNECGVLMWSTGRRGGVEAFGVQGMDVSPGVLAMCPYGVPGDRLWVRESFSGPHHQERHPPRHWHNTDPVHYWADGNPSDGDWTKPRPGMFMPRWASRLTLEVTEVRVERLQDISEADCWAEGVEEVMHDFEDVAQCLMAKRLGLCIDDAKPLYAQLWESINGPGSWDANPWLWCVSFRRIT